MGIEWIGWGAGPDYGGNKMKFDATLKLNKEFDTACTQHLRGQIVARLNNAQGKLSAVAPQSAQPKKVDDFFMMLGSMMMMSVLLHGVEHMICDKLGLSPDLLPEGSIAMAADFAIDLRDDLTENRAKNKVEGYPEGRKKAFFGDKKKTKNEFNLVCNGQQQRMEMDAHEEIRTMADLLEALDTVEKKGLTKLEIAEGQTIKQALYAAVRKPTAQVSHFMPLALAA